MIGDGVFVKVVAENNLSLIFFKQFRLKLFINNIIIKFAISETLLALVEQDLAVLDNVWWSGEDFVSLSIKIKIIKS